tara:strand:+ start:459 stop:956 length:498 start_codon:yes stop_codon:yes gene_type:complete
MAKHTWIKQIIHGIPVLVPNCVDAVEWLKKTKLDQGVLIDPRRPRNIQHHRKLFALLNLAVDNWPTETTTDALLSVIKIQTGHTEAVMVRASMLERFAPAFWKLIPARLKQILPAAIEVHVPKSINFESMGQDEFNPFYEKAIQLIALALGVDAETLDNEASENN